MMAVERFKALSLPELEAMTAEILKCSVCVRASAAVQWCLLKWPDDCPFLHKDDAIAKYGRRIP